VPLIIAVEVKMKTVSVDVYDGAIYETSIYKDKKGREIHLVSRFSSGYFSGKVADHQFHKLKNESFIFQEVFEEHEEYNCEGGDDTDFEYIGFTEEDEDKINEEIEETFFEDVFEKWGFAYDDTITEIWAEFKITVEET
jgi:hypothetical protein